MLTRPQCAAVLVAVGPNFRTIYGQYFPTAVTHFVYDNSLLSNDEFKFCAFLLEFEDDTVCDLSGVSSNPRRVALIEGSRFLVQHSAVKSDPSQKNVNKYHQFSNR